MPHLHRFYQPDHPLTSSDAVLSREESHHALRVLRVRVGDPVELFDGRGHAWRGSVSEFNRNEVRVDLAEVRFIPRPSPGLTLAQSWLHREKVLDDVVREATVLGVERMVFFRAEHSEKKPRLATKWERLAIEACKQCGRLWLPELAVADSLRAVLSDAEGDCIAVAAMDGPHDSFRDVNCGKPVVYVVGPEGDFSEDELEAMRSAGALALSLGEYTLRSEAAATVGLSLIQHHLGHIGRE